MLAAAESKLIDSVPRKLFVGGEWVEGAGAGTLAVEDPATGEVICEVADGREQDSRAALEAAAESQSGWAATSPNERGEILRRAFEAMREREQELALLMTMEMGKPLAESRGEVSYAADFLRWFSGEALRLDGGYKVSGDAGSRVLVMRQPVGPALLVTPWNFPLAMGTRKIAPAIAAGCTMVVKPAKQTPLSMLMLARILEQCGLPPGVLNLITTSSSAEVMRPLFSDPRLRKLSFTGSTEVGRTLIEQSAAGILKVSMELGGNAPFIVFADADLDAAVEGALIAKMRNGGEACTAANRFYVAEKVAPEFSRRLAGAMGRLTVGRGTDAGVQVGPLIDGEQLRKVSQLVEDAVFDGASTLVGGHALNGSGHFYSPTVLADVAPGSRLLREEIFGPVAPVVAFSDEAEAIERANETEYGLVGYVYTRDLERGLWACEALETGMVGLNRGLVSNAGAPFGGSKQSGIGREGGEPGIGEFLETKYVAMPAPRA